MAGPIPAPGTRRHISDPVRAAALRAEQERFVGVLAARAEWQADRAHFRAVDIELRRLKDFRARHARFLGLSPDTLKETSAPSPNTPPATVPPTMPGNQ